MIKSIRLKRKDGIMLEFKQPTLADKEWVTDCLSHVFSMNCEYTFGNLFIWSESYNTKICKYKDFLICHWEDFYSIPIGTGDFVDAMNAIFEDAKAKDLVPQIYGITQDNKTCLESYFPGQFTYSYNEDFNDYIYEIEKMTTLSGRKYHGKRNHITKFKKEHSDWSFEEITRENIPDCITVHKEWIENHPDCEEDCESELKAAMRAFDHFEELGFVGGLIRADGKAIAYTLGEALNREVFVTHFEKASSYMDGIYPLINQEFTIHCLQSYQYVNREEDLGLEGLRKSKRSYHPEIFLEKGIATYDKTCN
jgi:hypothetical protein